MDIAEQLLGHTIITGAVRRHDLGYLVLGQINNNKDQSPSRVAVRDSGKWLDPIELDWKPISCTVVHEPEERFIAISKRGL